METPIRVVIADDNADMRRIERMMISRAEGFEIVGEAEDGVQLLTLVEQEKPQLVFLDVEMPGKTGVECARVIQDMNPAIVLIFATAHDEYMGDAFEVYAFDYLLKPFRDQDLVAAIARVREKEGAARPAEDTLLLPKGDKSKYVLQTLSYIAEHYAEKLTLTGIASQFYISPYYLSRLFKKSINLSLIEYINGVRIKAAQNLIEKSNESISDIAEKTGFMTTAHFRRVFKDATGLSPQQYRQYYKRVNK